MVCDGLASIAIVLIYAVTAMFQPVDLPKPGICSTRGSRSTLVGVSEMLLTSRPAERRGRNYQDYAKHASLLTDIHAGHCPPHVRHAVEPRVRISTCWNLRHNL
jgi:hypothetical protein